MQNVRKPAASLVLLFLLIGLLPLAAQVQGPEKWEKTIRKFEQKDKESPVQPGAALFVGSSSIAMWRDMADYFPGHRVLNRGFGGSNFTDLLYYTERIIFPYRPSKVFVYEGDNDVAMGKDTKTILKEAKKLRKMIAKELGKSVPVIFISPKPSVARWKLKDQYLEVNAALKKFAERKKYTEYADVWYPAIGEDGKVFPHIFLRDKLHMNADGYKIWQKVLAPYLESN